MFPEYNTQLQSAESCISQLFHSKTSTFRLETVSKSCVSPCRFTNPCLTMRCRFFPNPQTPNKRQKGEEVSGLQEMIPPMLLGFQ